MAQKNDCDVEEFSEKVKLENELIEGDVEYKALLNDPSDVIFFGQANKEKYCEIVNLLPDAIIITVDGKIVLANKAACKYFNNLVNESAYKFVPNFDHIMKKRIDQIVRNKQVKTVFDYKITLEDKTVIDMEVSSSYLNFQGKPAVLSIMREITKRKKELNSASKMQKQLFKKPFTIPNKVKVDTLYVPARTVSGDFLYLCKKNENLLIGIIGDVCGKGITAALNISAFNVLFHEAALISYDPSEILNNLNRKVSDYLSERYIAACCFSFDFENKQAKVVGAGINQFIYQNSLTKCEKKIVKGSFLGMFEDSVFDEQIIHFNSGDRFYFFTDGLDFIFDDENISDIVFKAPTINKFTKGLKTSLNEMLTDVYGIQDDCTMISMEIK
jgi:PAS domain S-box-containing protein